MKFELITRAAGKVASKVSKHSPEILLGAGVISTVAGAVMACKATLKANDILDAHKEQMEKINEAAKTCPEDYTEQDKKKDTAITYGKTIGSFIKLYAPAIICEVAGIGCILASYGILKKRNVALTIAYGELFDKYMSYRDGVKAKYGEDADKELIFGTPETIIDTDENGDVKDVTIKDANDILKSPYARFFDSSCPNWEKSAEYNIQFLSDLERGFNDRLIRKGHVFLNEVYDAIGFERTAAGAVVGWIYKGGEGDGYIDFHIFDKTKEANRRFVNGLENVILLDFNVDGVIYDKI